MRCRGHGAHTFVGTGEGPCVILGARNRDFDDDTFWRVYRRSEAALRYGASVEADTGSGVEANAPVSDHWRVERPERWSELPWNE